MEHQDLVNEMAALEQLSTSDRAKLAKKRRIQQLKKWGQREKEWIEKEKKLHKKLANKLNEENNGLNLKQYTTYSSNHRSKKKLQLQTATNNNNNISNSNNNNNEFYNNNSSTKSSNLNPNGRVHFNVGVMLLEAAARNDFDEVKRLLMLGVSPDSVNHDGLTALHQCCIDASEPIMNLLLEFGANVDAKDTEQWTPLHAACTCGHLNLVEILVENGANLLAVNGDGNMPFDICEDEATLDYIESQMVKRGITQEMIDFTRASTEMQMIRDLEKQVAEGKDLSAADENGVTQLHIAAANGYLSVVKFLLRHGVNVNVCDNDLWQPLHGAACWGNEQHVKVIELLVEAGAHINAKTINDETVFDLCDNSELLEKLNQLKDELASKQATGTDKLRRTQSRTNSRVHSVRRTSVRDKNQISRREAREEALLRVENSPSASTTTTTNLNGTTNGQSHSIDDTTGDLNADMKQSSDSSVESSTSLVVMKKSNSLLSDQVDSGSTKPVVDRLNSNQAPLSNGFNSLLEVRKNKTEENLVRLNKKEHQAGDKNDVTPIRSHNSPTCTSSDDSITNSNKKQTSSKHDMTEHSISQNDSKQTFKSPSSSSQLISSVVDKQDDSEPHNQQQSIQSHVTVVQLAPINYTLSNLKKQRSDLRMRTTSIGGGLVSTDSTVSNDDTQVILDPQPLSLPSNGFNRPVSPSSTFRKFSGEPSEAIGGGDRNKRHGCCILI